METLLLNISEFAPAKRKADVPEFLSVVNPLKIFPPDPVPSVVLLCSNEAVLLKIIFFIWKEKNEKNT